MNEWGIPDWRDVAAYGQTSDWNQNRWFWEFLRRRDDLRQDFDAKKDEEYARALALWEWDNSVSPDGVKTPDDPGFHVGTFLIYPDRPAPENLPNPRVSEQPYGVLPRLYDRTLTQINRNHIHVGEQHYRVDFDLDLPIQPQLKEAANALREFQRYRHGKTIQKRRHSDKWLTYLQVLDARADGASWSEVASILIATAATDQTARDTHKQAQALCFNF